MSSFAASAPPDLAPLLQACDMRRKSDPTVVCAWCRETMHEGDPAKPVSHGICQSCELQKDAYLRTLDRAIARMCELRESLAAAR